MSITKLATSINSLFKSKKFYNIMLLGTLQNKWETIVGENISNATTIIEIKKQTIYIKCKNPTWKNELFYQKNELLKKIQKQTNTIKNIRII